LGAKPDVVNRWLRGVAIAEREAGSLVILSFQTPEAGSSEAFWILVDFVRNVNRVVPELQFAKKIART
jgi:hypothetical protein